MKHFFQISLVTMMLFVASWGQVFGEVVYDFGQETSSLITQNHPIAKQLKRNKNSYEYIDKLKTTKFGEHFATFNTYNENFRRKFNIPKDQIVVHHAVEKQAWETKYKSLGLTISELNSLENLRGIPEFQPDFEKDFHNSKIGPAWKIFYTQYPNATKSQILNKVKELENQYGKYFLPPTRGN